MVRSKFRGAILGAGSRSGIRVVVGRWHTSPLGSFADVMVETPDGHRTLLAPNAEVAAFVEATYSFDSVRIESVEVSETGRGWQIVTPSLTLEAEFGARTPLGWLLQLVPARIAESPAWCTITDPIARIVMRGVRTRGTAGGGRTEWYGASDNRTVTYIKGAFDGVELGQLRPVTPSPAFGFSSTPKAPSITTVVTTVEW